MTPQAAIPIRDVDIARSVELTLAVDDPEVVAELKKRADPAERRAFALTALRIGVLALRSADGQLDAGAIREAGAKLIGDVQTLLTQNATAISGEIGRALQAYLDPRTGSLPQRLDALTRKDGELERILGQSVSPDGSLLSESLARHLGERSPIFRMLSPGDANGLRAQLGETIRQALEEQRSAVVRQFSLDDKASALSRLVDQVRELQGGLQSDVHEQVDRVVKEFSLDKGDSALSRLVQRVEAAQKAIANEFSMDNEGSALVRISSLLDRTSKQIDQNLTLDNEHSALSRLRRELMSNLSGMAKHNSDFQAELRASVAALQAKRQADARGTVHGLDFEDQLGSWLAGAAQNVGDLHEATGASAGTVPRCKTGDHVVELGPDSAAPGVRVVWEAKQVGAYTLKKATEEIDEARRNRGASIGVFVFSKRTAADGLARFQRIGHDFFVVWDAEDRGTDLVLEVTYSAARALAVREQAGEEAHEVAATIDTSIRAIEKKLEKLDSIVTMASTIETNGRKIRDTAANVLDELKDQIERLDGQVTALKQQGD
jgi:hypothetical protein